MKKTVICWGRRAPSGQLRIEAAARQEEIEQWLTTGAGQSAGFGTASSATATIEMPASEGGDRE